MSRVAEQLGWPEQEYPHRPGFKVAGGTSEEAAKAIAPRAKKLHGPILERLRQFPGGLTPDEIAEHLNVSILSVRPRCSELLRAGEVRKSGSRRLNKTGNSADVLVLAKPLPAQYSAPNPFETKEPF